MLSVGICTLECLCICKRKPALMLANASIYCSLCIVSWPSSTVHGLHAAKSTNVYMATLMVCQCMTIFAQFNSACCKLFLYNEAQDNHIHIAILCMGDVPTVYCCRNDTP